ncbi:helix-turn-helix domain-containing protein [Actinoplanes sp. NBC_00393]
MPAEQHTELITALHGPWRTATRMVIVVLSAAGSSASEIADLLQYDPATVRRLIARHQHEGLAGLPERPRKGSRRLGQRIGRLTPKAWTTARLWRALGRPQISLSTLRRRIREQARWCRPRLIAKSDPHHDQICADIRTRITALPTGSVVLAEDETHLDLLPRLRSCWMRPGSGTGS